MACRSDFVKRYREDTETDSDRKSNTEWESKGKKGVMRFKVRGLQKECEGEWIKERQREERRGRSAHSVQRVSSPVMTEQQPHHDGALVPMTTQPVRWREEKWMDAGKERTDGGKDRQTENIKIKIVYSRGCCCAVPLQRCVWHGCNTRLSSALRPFSSSLSSPSSVLQCPFDRVVSSSLSSSSCPPPPPSSLLPSPPPPPPFLLPFRCVFVTPECVRAAAAAAAPVSPCSASRRGWV